MVNGELREVNISDRLTVQLESEWRAGGGGNGILIEQLFQTFIAGKDLTSKNAAVLTEEFYGYLAKQYKSQSDGGHLGKNDDAERTLISYPVKWRQETKAFMLETARKAGFPNVSGMDEAQNKTLIPC